MLSPWLVVAIISMIPVVELRLAIPVGVLTGSVTIPLLGEFGGYGLSPWPVFLVCVITNFLVAVWLYPLLEFSKRFLVKRWHWFGRFYEKRVAKAQLKLKPKMDKYGWLGLAVFIGTPLPGTGVYTGTLAAYGLGMSHRKVLLASLLGVLLAGVAVLALTLGLNAIF